MSRNFLKKALRPLVIIAGFVLVFLAVDSKASKPSQGDLTGTGVAHADAPPPPAGDSAASAVAGDSSACGDSGGCGGDSLASG